MWEWTLTVALSFGHERYQQASQALRECQNVEKMHYIIAETLLKVEGPETQLVHERARHICYALSVIQRRIADRYRFRRALLQASALAIASGARPTALWYMENCLKLLQDDPWRNGAYDVYYEETLDIHTKAAEILWYQGQTTEALRILSSLSQNARTAADKAPSWILQSRISTQKGDTLTAFRALKTSLAELGLEFEMETSWEVCDTEYQGLKL